MSYLSCLSILNPECVKAYPRDGYYFINKAMTKEPKQTKTKTFAFCFFFTFLKASTAMTPWKTSIEKRYILARKSHEILFIYSACLSQPELDLT